MPVAQAASTSVGTISYSLWSGYVNYELPFAIYENGKILQVQVVGGQLASLTKEGSLEDIRGNFIFSEKQKYPFVAKAISQSELFCGPEYDLFNHHGW